MVRAAVLAKQPIDVVYPNEAAFRAHIRARARALGWMVYEVPNSRFVQGNGYPDLTMVHPERRRVVWAECKTDIGRYTEDQGKWIDALFHLTGPGIYVFLWRPSNAVDIEQFLQGVGQWAS